MKLEVLRTINLINVSKRAVEMVMAILRVPLEQIENEEWKSMQNDVLIDLLNSDEKALEDSIAENFSNQLHEAMLRKVNSRLRDEDGAE